MSEASSTTDMTSQGAERGRFADWSAQSSPGPTKFRLTVTGLQDLFGGLTPLRRWEANPLKNPTLLKPMRAACPDEYWDGIVEEWNSHFGPDAASDTRINPKTCTTVTLTANYPDIDKIQKTIPHGGMIIDIGQYSKLDLVSQNRICEMLTSIRMQELKTTSAAEYMCKLVTESGGRWVHMSGKLGRISAYDWDRLGDAEQNRYLNWLVGFTEFERSSDEAGSVGAADPKNTLSSRYSRELRKNAIDNMMSIDAVRSRDEDYYGAEAERRAD